MIIWQISDTESFSLEPETISVMVIFVTGNILCNFTIFFCFFRKNFLTKSYSWNHLSNMKNIASQVAKVGGKLLTKRILVFSSEFWADWDADADWFWLNSPTFSCKWRTCSIRSWTSGCCDETFDELPDNLTRFVEIC